MAGLVALHYIRQPSYVMSNLFIVFIIKKKLFVFGFVIPLYFFSVVFMFDIRDIGSTDNYNRLDHRLQIVAVENTHYLFLMYRNSLSSPQY